MKLVILAGGRGTRISEETEILPKPMVEIGGKPIIWHVMKIYSHYGFNDFIICLGYKGYMIKEYFANYFIHSADITLNLKDNKMEILGSSAEPWRVTLIDTGINTMTGGRVKRVKKYIKDQTFMLTYGDGVSDINIKDELAFHKRCGGLMTLAAVQVAGRFGALNISGSNCVKSFFEKPKGDGAWINGGFCVVDPQVLNYIKDDSTVLEYEPLERLANEKRLYAYKHSGFWKCMDSLRDKVELEQIWNSSNPCWKIWKD